MGWFNHQLVKVGIFGIPRRFCHRLESLRPSAQVVPWCRSYVSRLQWSRWFFALVFLVICLTDSTMVNHHLGHTFLELLPGISIQSEEVFVKGTSSNESYRFTYPKKQHHVFFQWKQDIFSGRFGDPMVIVFVPKTWGCQTPLPSMVVLLAYWLGVILTTYKSWEPILQVSLPYHSHSLRDSYRSGVQEQYRWLGVPRAGNLPWRQSKILPKNHLHVNPKFHIKCPNFVSPPG